MTSSSASCEQVGCAGAGGAGPLVAGLHPAAACLRTGTGAQIEMFCPVCGQAHEPMTDCFGRAYTATEPVTAIAPA